MCTIAILLTAFSEEGSSYLEVVGTGLAWPGSVDYEKMTGLAVSVASIAAAHRVVVR